MKNNPCVSIEKFQELLPQICDSETTLDAAGWTKGNPLWGHCAVVSLLAQNIFGGELLRASLEHVPEFAHMRSHYFNELTDGASEDFTKPQFGERYPADLKTEVRTRSYLLSNENTKNRYKLLAWRLAKLLSNSNPIFGSAMYEKCFLVALDSPCQKMKFGCVITHHGEVVYSGCNQTIEPLKSLCDTICIRHEIASRTESMIGACGHAEELGIWEVVRSGIPIHECDLYIAGVYPNGLPWLKQEAEHTCLRCSVQMYNAKIQNIFVPVVDKWIGISSTAAVETARVYALKQKKV